MEKILKSILIRGPVFIISLIIIFLSVIAFINATKWIGKTYPGFFVYKNRIVSIIQPVSFYLRTNFIRYPAVILKVDGIDVADGKEIYKYVEQFYPEKIIHYTIREGNKINELKIPAGKFSLKDFVSICGALSLIGLAGIVFSIILLFLRTDTKASWIFTGLSISIGCWLTLTFDYMSDYVFIYILPGMICFITLFIVLLSLYFPEEKKLIRRKKWIILLPFIPSIGTGISYGLTLTDSSAYLLTDLFVWSYAGLSVLFFVGSIIHDIFYSSTAEAKKRAKVVLWSSGIPVLVGGLIFTSVVFTKSRIPIIYAPFSFLFWLFFIGYTIFKHNIFEIDVAVRRTVIYGIITITIATTYLLVLSILSYFFGAQQEAFKSPLFTIIFSLFVLFVFIPFRDRVKDIIDRTFYRERYELEKTLEQAVEAMATMINIEKLLEKLLDSLSSALHLERAGIMLPSREGDFVLKKGFGGLENIQILKGNPILKLIYENKEPVIRNNLSNENSHGEVKAQMEKYGIKVIIPMLYRERVCGLMLLGEKLSGAEYIKDDLKLLKIFGKQAAIAIENARLHEEEKERERMAHELESARRIQLSLLPRGDPVIPGYDISGISIPARKVGGDYYGYFKQDENKLCITIADVTGKGMPSAIMMSMVCSSMSALIKTRKSPREILSQLNDIICETRRKLPVTLFLAIIDTTTNVMQYSNAGHDYPYLYQNDNLFFIECRGLPLGCFEDYQFEEREIKLKKDDIIVFYTDGIIETQNLKREMFGFKRLESTILRYKNFSAKDIKNRIIDEALFFTGDKELLDDMTLVVVKIK